MIDVASAAPITPNTISQYATYVPIPHIGNNDLWIAAHAKAAGLTVVTNNEHEFRRVPGLKVQNWVG